MGLKGKTCTNVTPFGSVVDVRGKMHWDLTEWKFSGKQAHYTQIKEERKKMILFNATTRVH